MNNDIKNKIIELHLKAQFSQKEIAEQCSVAQSTVSKTVSAYKKGTFIYNDTTVGEYEEDIPTSSSIFIADEEPSDDLPTLENTKMLPTVMLESKPVANFKNSILNPINQNLQSSVVTDPPSSTYENSKTEEQTHSLPVPNLLDKSKITFTNHGLWLNQFALKLIGNPVHLAYSLDNDKCNLYIEPFNENNKNSFYYCKAKCSKNYTKTANKQLINDLQELLELHFKENLNINFEKDSFKILFKFTFENNQFNINIPTGVGQITI